MTNLLMRALLGLALGGLSPLALGQSCNPAEPRADPGTSFSAFATLERLEVRGGRPGTQDWEWGLGTNTQQTGSFVKSYLDWVSGRVLTYTLTYNGAGAGSFTVHDGATQLATQTWNDPAKPLRTGNALKLYVKSSADSGTATVQATVSTINGLPASGSIQTAGNSQFSEQAMYWYFPGMASGFTVTGTVTLTFPGTNPPQGSRLNFIVTAGTITCQQASAPPGMYFIHVDHLNTPRLVADAAGTTMWRWDQQEPFGVNVPDENPSGLGVFDLPLRLPGQYFDKETNLHYNYFRDYDPSIGRYAESDPIGLRGGLNTYSYVNGSPLLYIDPKGEAGMVAAFTAAAVGMTVGAGVGAITGGGVAYISGGNVQQGAVSGAIVGGLVGLVGAPFALSSGLAQIVSGQTLLGQFGQGVFAGYASGLFGGFLGGVPGGLIPSMPLFISSFANAGPTQMACTVDRQ